MLAIAFALRGTLTRTDHLESESFMELLRERCAALRRPVAEAEAAAIAHDLFASGGRVAASGDRLARAVSRLIGEPVSQPVLIARFRQIGDRLAERHVTSTTAVRQTLERIASLGIPTAVLCNGWSRISQREAEIAGFTGPVLVSEDIGFEAPERRAFDKLVETVAVPAEFVWFVGTDPQRDIDGAVKAGLKAVWFRRWWCNRLRRYFRRCAKNIRGRCSPFAICCAPGSSGATGTFFHPSRTGKTV
jgi:FMN phosphatase YigB (HAD superfamily)